MDLIERALFLSIGGGIGFILGYIVARLQDIETKVDRVKEEIHEVDVIVKNDRLHDESGQMRFPKWRDIALFLVIFLTAFAAFSSQRATNDVQETQDRVIGLSLCNQEFLSRTIIALNERTEYSVQQIDSNVELQKAQAKFFRILIGQPASDEAEIAAAQEYLDALTKFVTVSSEASEFQPYPTEEALRACLDRETEGDPR